MSKRATAMDQIKGEKRPGGRNDEVGGNYSPEDRDVAAATAGEKGEGGRRWLRRRSGHKEKGHRKLKGAIVAVVTLGLAALVGIPFAIIKACRTSISNSGSLRGTNRFGYLYGYGLGVAAGISIVLTVYVRKCSHSKKFFIFAGIVSFIFSLFSLNVVASGFTCQVSSVTFPRVANVEFPYTGIPALVLLGLTVAHLFVVVQGRIAPFPYRVLVAFPCYIHCTSVFLMLPFTPFVGFIPKAPFSWIPWGCAILIGVSGLIQSIRTPRLSNWEVVTLQHPSLPRTALNERHEPVSTSTSSIDDQLTAPEDPPAVQALPRNVTLYSRQNSTDTSGDQLQIVQITDPHLGSLMTVKRLRRICEDAVKTNPDLIFLTGDFFTVEANNQPDILQHALQPLLVYKGKNKVFACLGNHDIEAPFVTTMVENGLKAIGATLLVDETTIVETRLGLVEIIGLSFAVAWKRRDNIDQYFSAKYLSDQRQAAKAVGLTSAQNTTDGSGGSLAVGATGPIRQRFVLLHDPSGFPYLPQSLQALVLSGHTHGGQIGLFSFGLEHWTVVRAFGGYDNGPWSCGDNLLYVHRGQGSRSLLSNFIVRLGVPPEFSLVKLKLFTSGTNAHRGPQESFVTENQLRSPPVGSPVAHYGTVQ